MHATPGDKAGPNQQRRRRLSLLWAALTVLWTLVRAAAVHAGLSEYGVNTGVFLSIDLASAIADGYATPKAVIAIVDQQHAKAAKWMLVFAIAFAVPDIYVFAAGDRVPLRAYLVLAVIVTFTSTLAVVALVKRVRATRAALLDAALAGSAPVSSQAAADLARDST